MFTPFYSQALHHPSPSTAARLLSPFHIIITICSEDDDDDADDAVCPDPDPGPAARATRGRDEHNGGRDSGGAVRRVPEPAVVVRKPRRRMLSNYVRPEWRAD